jgi:hypothetical protein
MTRRTISNPYSTGGGGVSFELMADAIFLAYLLQGDLRGV